MGNYIDTEGLDEALDELDKITPKKVDEAGEREPAASTEPPRSGSTMKSWEKVGQAGELPKNHREDSAVDPEALKKQLFKVQTEKR